MVQFAIIQKLMVPTGCGIHISCLELSKPWNWVNGVELISFLPNSEVSQKTGNSSLIMSASFGLAGFALV